MVSKPLHYDVIETARNIDKISYQDRNAVPPPDHHNRPLCEVCIGGALDRLVAIGRFRITDQSVALGIKALAIQVGPDPARYTGHSLRGGFLKWPSNRATSHSICWVTMYVIRSAWSPMQLKVCFSISSVNDSFFRATILLSSGYRRHRVFPLFQGRKQFFHEGG
jgi:hypothetical protein